MTSPTPLDLLNAVQAGRYAIKHIQDVSMLYLHHFLLAQPGIAMSDATSTPLSALPPTWNASPNMVFLRYIRTMADGSSTLITLKFGRKENGTMDLHVKSASPPVSKSLKFKTFSKSDLGGAITATESIRPEELSAAGTGPAVIASLTAGCSEIASLLQLQLDNTALSASAPAPAPAPSTTTPSAPITAPSSTTMSDKDDTTNKDKPTKPNYFLHSAPDPVTPTAPGPTTSTATNPAAPGGPHNLPVRTAHGGIPSDGIIGDPKPSPQPGQPNKPSIEENTAARAAPQPVALNLPQVDKGLHLPSDNNTSTSALTHPAFASDTAAAASTSTSHDPPLVAARVPDMPAAPLTSDPAPTGGPALSPQSQPDPGLRQPRINPSNPAPFDPYSGEMNTGPLAMTDRGFRNGGGHGAGPGGGGFHDPFQGGNLMGPGQFPRGPMGGGGPGGPQFPGGGAMGPPGGARYDPIGPFGIGEPDNDHLRRPGFGQPPGGPGNRDGRGRGGPGTGPNGPNNGQFNGGFF